jgi:hypothetical protein
LIIRNEFSMLFKSTYFTIEPYARRAGLPEKKRLVN